MLCPIQQVAAAEGITSSNCNADIVCLCSDNRFLTSIEGAIETQCSLADGESKYGQIFLSLVKLLIQ